MKKSSTSRSMEPLSSLLRSAFLCLMTLFLSSNFSIHASEKDTADTSVAGMEVSGKIYFQRNHTDIVQTYMGNDAQFASMLERLDSIHSDDILGVKIVGSASPEGPLEFNTYLAIHRAAAIKEYLIKNYSDIFTDSLNWKSRSSVTP